MPRIFTMGELWGPMICEYVGCSNETEAVELTDEENDSLPEKYGPKAANFICENKLGKALCYKHRSEKLF